MRAGTKVKLTFNLYMCQYFSHLFTSTLPVKLLNLIYLFRKILNA